MLDLTVVTGNNDLLVALRRDTLLGALGPGDLERLDLSEGGGSAVVDLIGTGSLFGVPRHGLLDHLEADLDTLDVLETYGPTSDARVVATFHGKPTKAVTVRLAALGATLDAVVSPTKPNDRAALIRSMASAAGVTVDTAGATLLATRLGDDWARVGSIITQLSAGEYVTPSVAQLEVLAGSATEDAVPWTVTDAAARRDRPATLAAARGVEPVVLSTWVTGETIRLAETVEQGWSADAAASELSLHTFRAQKLARWATSVDPACIPALLIAAARLDAASKTAATPHREAMVQVELARWVDALQPARR